MADSPRDMGSTRDARGNGNGGQCPPYCLDHSNVTA
jgi:hypothetical protein